MARRLDLGPKDERGGAAGSSHSPRSGSSSQTRREVTSGATTAPSRPVEKNPAAIRPVEERDGSGVVESGAGTGVVVSAIASPSNQSRVDFTKR